MTTLPTSDAHAAEQATPAATAVQTIAEPVPSVVGASGDLLGHGVSLSKVAAHPTNEREAS